MVMKENILYLIIVEDKSQVGDLVSMLGFISCISSTTLTSLWVSLIHSVLHFQEGISKLNSTNYVSWGPE
jgi:hypothetical protein